MDVYDCYTGDEAKPEELDADANLSGLIPRRSRVCLAFGTVSGEQYPQIASSLSNQRQPPMYWMFARRDLLRSLTQG